MKVERTGSNQKREKRTWNSWSPNDVSIKNPWLIAGLLCLVLSVVATAATLLLGFPRSVALALVKIIYCGYWGASLLYDLRGRHWVKATFDAIFLFIGLLWH